MSQKLFRLQYLRKKAGYTQETMALKLDLSTVQYQKIEQGKSNLTLENARKIVRVLNVRYIDDLFDDAS